MAKQPALQQFQFTIPQKNGKTVEILTVDAFAGTKSLGVNFDLANLCVHQVSKIKSKGFEWASRLNSDAYISRSNAWCSFNFQLKPALSYSAVTLSADPKKLSKVQRSIFYKSLPQLGVNRSIWETMQRILHRYGGLAMFDLSITCLGAKLHHLRSHWHQLTPEGDHLRQLYETFLMDFGLGGNIFAKNFNSLGFLAEHN